MGEPETIFLLDPLRERFLPLIEANLPPEFRLLKVSGNSEEERVRKAPAADYIFVFAVKLSRDVIRAATRLKFIQKLGVGTERIDLEAAREVGVPVAKLAGTNAISVAEHTFLLILSIYRNFMATVEILRKGDFKSRGAFVGSSSELWGKTLGILGLGNCGRQVARRAKGMGMKTIYYDKYRRPPSATERDLGVEFREREEVIRESDILSLHLPLTDETRGMIGEGELSRMKKSAILINTARGAIVDEGALYKALKEGVIAGAGLDVFSKEPPDIEDPLFSLPNVVATPHFGAAAKESDERIVRHALDNLRNFSLGLPLREEDVVVPSPGLRIESAPEPPWEKLAQEISGKGRG